MGSTLASSVLWVLVIAALGYGVVMTAIQAAALFTA
ncbi:MFS transporter small subunit [Spiractinospora alimapuensis]